MAISGPEALRSLDRAVGDIRREETDISRRLTRSSELVAKLRETEAEHFLRLAKLRLSPDVQEELGNRLTRAEKTARTVLERHGKKLAELNSKIESADQDIAKLAHDRADALEHVETAQSDLSKLSKEIASAVSADPEFADKRREADELRKIAEESLSKTQTAEGDRELKGKPYRDDPLFMYLWERGFGTKTYKANNLVRYLDSLVARLIGYHDARPNYTMLNEIPLRLREHTELQIAAADEADEELDKLEARAIEKAGGGPLRAALLAARDKVDAIDSHMVQLEDQRDQLSRDLADLAERPDAAMDLAADGLAQSLQSAEFSKLVSAARRTSTQEDDAILAQIDDARLRIIDEEDEVKELRDRQRVLARRRRELEDIEFEFKKARFDDPRSSFREDDLIGDLLGEFLRGAITASSYWGHWRRSQSWRRGSTDWGGSVGLPRTRRSNMPNISFGSGKNWGSFGSNRGSSKRGNNRGFSRPRSGSRGKRKSGGFKTGGGF